MKKPLQCSGFSERTELLLVVAQLWRGVGAAHAQQAGLRVDGQLGAGVDQVQVTHGQLADAVDGAERRVFDLSMDRRSGA